MSTYASICGGPYTGPLDELFFRFTKIDTSEVPPSNEFDVACVTNDSSFYLWGDWDVISNYGEEFCILLSQRGKAGVFMGQDTSDYYRITMFENGRQTSEEIFHPEEAPEGKFSSLDDLWEEQEKITAVDIGDIDEARALKYRLSTA